MSVILINAQNGSRTIVHHRGAMPEISLDDFKQNVRLEEFSSGVDFYAFFKLKQKLIDPEPKLDSLWR